jgi:acyl-CoA synthetase (AMP-forming)/AMP-acid ligase II
MRDARETALIWVNANGGDRLSATRPYFAISLGVTAMVWTAPGALSSEPAALAAPQDRLARYKPPKRIFFLEAPPRNAMGKVQKNMLRDVLKGLYDR